MKNVLGVTEKVQRNVSLAVAQVREDVSHALAEVTISTENSARCAGDEDLKIVLCAMELVLKDVTFVGEKGIKTV